METQRMRLMSFSDNAEDVLLMRAFRDFPASTFVDVGAGDPVVGSVTRNLSTLLHWNGVHIEPNHELADALETAYPDDHVVRCAVGSRVSTAELYRVGDEWGLSTLSESVAVAHRDSGLPVRSDLVEVDTLENLLHKCSVEPGFGLLKVDVEGGESEVLAGFSLHQWRPLVILVEVTYPNTPDLTDLPWEADVRGAGYDLALFDGLNHYYVADDQPLLRDRLAVPANVFDRYVPHYWYDRMAVDQRPEVEYFPW